MATARPLARHDVFGVRVSETTYASATDRIVEAAVDRRSFAVTALAVHGLMLAADDGDLRARINQIDLVTPDGQPVRWALRALHGVRLPDRVHGPTLAWRVLAEAEARDLSVFLFGSTDATVEAYAAEISRRHPDLRIVGVQSDRFREATAAEDEADVETINRSGAGIVLVGRGCPLQERWVADHRGRVDAAMLAVGAAFDYGAGNLKEPPTWVQRAGLHWLWRLAEEPRRLWRRYLHTNSRFLMALPRAWLRQRFRR